MKPEQNTHTTSNSLGERFIAGAGWSLIASAISQGANLCALMLVARILTKEPYGQLVLIQNSVATATVLASLGINTTITHYVATLRERESDRLERILGLCQTASVVMGGVATAALALVAPKLATSVLHAPELSGPLTVGCLAVLFTTADAYFKGLILGFSAVRSFTLVTALGVALGVPITVCATVQFGLNGACWALVINAAIQASLSLILSRYETNKWGGKVRIWGSLTEWRVIRDYAWPFALSAALANLAHWICQASLTHQANGYSEVALLGIAMQWFNVVTFLPLSAGRVLAPLLAEQVAEGHQEGPRYVALLAFITNGIVVVPVALAICLASSWIIKLYGINVSGGENALSIAAISAAIYGLSTPAINLIMAKSSIWLILGLNAAWAAAYTAIGLSSVHLGAQGVASALAISHFGHAVLLAIWTYRYFANPVRD